MIIGDTLLNYGGGTLWNGGNAAGLMMECASNTEIVVHDGGNRLASLMYYEGDLINKITIGRDMGWGAISDIIFNGTIKLNNSTTCISSLNVSGITTLQGNLDCGGGIAINGSNAFYNPFGTIDAANLTNTYLNLKVAGTDNDWCYLRQIGGSNSYKLSLD